MSPTKRCCFAIDNDCPHRGGPLGEGILDMRAIVDTIRRAKPDVHFSLEMITRDPLQVPCLTEKYWSTFQEVPGVDLARTLARETKQDADAVPESSDT